LLISQERACASPVAPQVVNKKFAFADKHRLPFVFVSASDGSNVVKVFNMAVQAGLRWRAAPKADFYQEVGTAPGLTLRRVPAACTLVCRASWRQLPAAMRAAGRARPPGPRLQPQVLQLLGQADIKPGQQLVEEDRLAKAAAVELELADRAAAAGKLVAVHARHSAPSAAAAVAI
jgi:hypothetical protein